jgi:hypothetical protein
MRPRRRFDRHVNDEVDAGEDRLPVDRIYGDGNRRDVD